MAQENERGLFASFSQSLFVAQDKVKDHGEDSYLLAFRENAGVCAVFDGLGGSGSRQYKEYGDKTGAYIASRAVSEELYNWFLLFSEDQAGLAASKLSQDLKARIDKRLSACKDSEIKKSSLNGRSTDGSVASRALRRVVAKSRSITAYLRAVCDDCRHAGIDRLL